MLSAALTPPLRRFESSIWKLRGCSLDSENSLFQPLICISLFHRNFSRLKPDCCHHPASILHYQVLTGVQLPLRKQR